MPSDIADRCEALGERVEPKVAWGSSQSHTDRAGARLDTFMVSVTSGDMVATNKQLCIA
ncbi:hypothetical protein HKB17_00275, partial [Vibrio parahaemolyticus]|nr:hypothetical protein [Vibrio parahaemolyticus]